MRVVLSPSQKSAPIDFLRSVKAVPNQVSKPASFVLNRNFKNEPSLDPFACFSHADSLNSSELETSLKKEPAVAVQIKTKTRSIT